MHVLTRCQLTRVHNQEETKMIKGTPALIAERREEIVNACEQLYQTRSFKEITLKEIGKVTSFSRPTIYNYFQTREEIFLALFQREYDRWNEELEAIIEENESLTRKQVAEKIAHSLENRQQLLKLLSMNNFDMEANSRQEMLTRFKASYGRSMRNIRGILDKFCTGMSDEDKQNFIYVFYPFMFGIYPYSAVSEKEKQAIKAINVVTKKQALFVGKSWIKKSGIDAMFHNRHLSTHDELDENAEVTIFDKLARTFEDQYDLLDSVIVETQVELSAKRYFQITYKYGDTRLTKKLSHSGKNVIIDTSIYNVDEEKLEPRDVMLTIDYINEDTGETIYVKDVEISYIPNKIDD